MEIKKYKDLEKIENNMVVDLSKLEPKIITRAIDFLTGLTFKKGKLTKIASYKYLIKIKE